MGCRCNRRSRGMYRVSLEICSNWKIAVENEAFLLHNKGGHVFRTILVRCDCLKVAWLRAPLHTLYLNLITVHRITSVQIHPFANLPSQYCTILLVVWSWCGLSLRTDRFWPLQFYRSVCSCSTAKTVHMLAPLLTSFSVFRVAPLKWLNIQSVQCFSCRNDFLASSELALKTTFRLYIGHCKGKYM